MIGHEFLGVFFIEGGFLGLFQQADLAGFHLFKGANAVGGIGDKSGNPEGFLRQLDRPAGEDGFEFAEGIDCLALGGQDLVLGAGTDLGRGLGHEGFGTEAEIIGGRHGRHCHVEETGARSGNGRQRGEDEGIAQAFLALLQGRCLIAEVGEFFAGG